MRMRLLLKSAMYRIPDGEEERERGRENAAATPNPFAYAAVPLPAIVRTRAVASEMARTRCPVNSVT